MKVIVFVMSWKDAVSVIFSDTFGYKYQIFSYRVKSQLPSFIYTASIIARLILCSVTAGVSWTSWFERKLMLSGRITGEIGEVGKSIHWDVLAFWH